MYRPGQRAKEEAVVSGVMPRKVRALQKEKALG
jgi:hypothetical protein